MLYPIIFICKKTVILCNLLNTTITHVYIFTKIYDNNYDNKINKINAWQLQIIEICENNCNYHENYTNKNINYDNNYDSNQNIKNINIVLVVKKYYFEKL